MIKAFKIPRGLPTAIVGEREKSPKGYNINRVLPAVDLFLCLKNESHKIHNYQKQLPYLLALCKCSKATFYKRLKECESRGLVKIEKKRHIWLTSWHQLAQIFMYDERLGFHTVNYNLDDDKQEIRYILKALEIRENEERQVYAIAKRLAAHPDNKQAYEQFCYLNGLNGEFNLKDYEAAKKRSFALGTERSIYDLLHELNLSLSRNVNTIANAHGYKHWQGAAYLKAQLAARELIKVVQITPTICYYKNSKNSEDTKKGSTKFGRFYNNVNKVALWYHPDEIEINSALFSKNPKTQQNTAKSGMAAR